MTMPLKAEMAPPLPPFEPTSCALHCRAAAFTRESVDEADDCWLAGWRARKDAMEGH
jgi:hypothetical protein